MNAHPTVRAQALLVQNHINQALRSFGIKPQVHENKKLQLTHYVSSLEKRPVGMSELAYVNWQVFSSELNKKPDSGGSSKVSCAVM